MSMRAFAVGGDDGDLDGVVSRLLPGYRRDGVAPSSVSGSLADVTRSPTAAGLPLVLSSDVVM